MGGAAMRCCCKLCHVPTGVANCRVDDAHPHIDGWFESEFVQLCGYAWCNPNPMLAEQTKAVRNLTVDHQNSELTY